MHQKEEIIGQIVLLHSVRLEPVWDLVKVLFSQSADETLGLHVILDLLLLITQLAESIDD